MIIFIEVIYDTRTLYSIDMESIESVESVENIKTNILIKICGLLNKTFMGTNWNWENLRLTLPEIMSLKCFSRNAESFPVE